MVHLKNLTKSFGANKAVDDLSLDIPAGEVFGLLGPNGAGKTTTVNLAVGLLEPDSGEVSINGAGSPLNPAVRSGLGIAPQATAVYSELSAEENLVFFGRLQALRGARLMQRVEEALAFAGLTDRRHDRVSTFSGGMKRRLNLVVALIHEPAIVFMDEPTAGVDPQSRNALFENIEKLREAGKTIIYTTHYMEEAQRLCDRVGIMDHGRLMALGTVDDLIREHGGYSILTAAREDQEFRVETNDPVAELVRIQEGGQLIRFRVESPDLERVFLNLTGRKLRD